jgi:phosphate-selective porin
MRSSLIALASWIALAFGCAAGARAEKIESGAVAAKQNSEFEFVMKKRPSLRFGDLVKVDFRTKIQADFRGFSEDVETEAGMFDPRRVRFGVEGRFAGDFEFEVEYELLPNDYQLRDAFLNYRRWRSLQFQAGKFKVPFGMDQRTGPTNLDFVYRSRIGAQLTPGRDTGLMLHGNFFEKGLRYEAGLFRHDGEIADAADDYRTGGATSAARIEFRPAAFFSAPRLIENLQFAAAATYGHVREGQHSLRGRTSFGETFYSRMFVNGARMRQGAEVSWLIGGLALNGEFINVREQRRGQSLLGADLPDLFARGWYVSAVHPLFGRRPQGSSNRFAEYLPGLRHGALEAAARYEQIRFGSGPSAALPSRSTRASNVLGTSDRGLTFGLNWYPTRHTKFQVNAVREMIEDAFRAPVSGTNRYWTIVGRLQFVL